MPTTGHCNVAAVRALVLAGSILTWSCTGTIAAGPPDPGERSSESPAGTGGTGSSSFDPPEGVTPASAVRRLSIREYNNVVAALIYDTSSPLRYSDDPRTPFDNDYTTDVQKASTTLVDTMEVTASEAAMGLLVDKKRLGRVMTSVGCTPRSAADAACFNQFISRFGRRALRRPLTPAEVQSFMGLLAVAQEDGDFYAAVATAVRAFLQFPELLYRMEADTGAPVRDQPGAFWLNGWEMASRLSFLLWGEGPDDALLDRAQGGGLASAQGVRDAVSAMLADTRAQRMVSMLQAMWLNFEGLQTSGPLGRSMTSQTSSLVRKVIFDERRPWRDLLRSEVSYVDYNLAKHYQLDIPAGSRLKQGAASFEWLSWGADRVGLLSEGSFLGLAQATTEEQMVIRRGKMIRERLLCQTLPAKPANVKPSTARPGKPCKYDVLQAATSAAGCNSCHGLLNPVGYGLDRYDGAGAPRTHDRVDEFIRGKFPALKVGDELAQCPVHDEGDLDGQKFSGPKELAQLLLASTDLDGCLAQQVYRFAIGRSALDDNDRLFIASMKERAGTAPLVELLTDLAASDAFRCGRPTN